MLKLCIINGNTSILPSRTFPLLSSCLNSLQQSVQVNCETLTIKPDNFGKKNVQSQ